jgi:hypothetical protein
MTILFGWNTYLLKSVSTSELGLFSKDLPTDLRIEYRQRYFHLFFIPLFPIGRFWAVRKGAELYHTSAELQQTLQNIKPNWKHGLWAWTGPLLGIIIWIFVSVSSSLEERAYQKRVENNKNMLSAFFHDKKNTTPLDNKLLTMNSLIDSSLDKVDYEQKKIDTSFNKLLGLYLSASMTQQDSLTGYNKTNTYVISDFPRVDMTDKHIIDKDCETSLHDGDWKGYNDTSSVYSELRKLEHYKYVLVLKEYNRVDPEPRTDGFISGYSFAKGRLLSIETGKELANFNIMAPNSDSVSQFKFRGKYDSYGGSSSLTQLRTLLESDLERNVVKKAFKYVFRKEDMY